MTFLSAGIATSINMMMIIIIVIIIIISFVSPVHHLADTYLETFFGKQVKRCGSCKE